MAFNYFDIESEVFMKSVPFKLYTHHHSANGRKVLAIVSCLKLQPEIIPINVYAGEGQEPDYLKINPFGKIPTLVDGEFILWESNAILQYIAEKYGNYQLSSRDVQIRAEIIQWFCWEQSHWQTSISTVLAPVVGHKLVPALVPKPKEAPNWKHPEFNRWVNFLNIYLGKKKFLVNNQFSTADISVAGMVTYFRFAEFPFQEFPAFRDWYEHIESLDAWKESESPLWAAI
jgi:glutathione S-transferase